MCRIIVETGSDPARFLLEKESVYLEKIEIDIAKGGKRTIVFIRNLENILNRFRERMVPMAFAETFKALSDPVRREILVLLKKEKLSAGEIGKHFEMTGATISYHLKILKKADLIRETKYKNFIYYELNISVVEELMLWLSDLKGDSTL